MMDVYSPPTQKKANIMSISSPTLEQPVSPPEKFGLELRPRQLSDFHFTFQAGGILLLLALLTVAGANQLVGPEWLGYAMVALGMVAGAVTLLLFLASFSDPGDRIYEYNEEGYRLSKEWQNEVLKPFLEQKYGITFVSGRVFTDYGLRTATKDYRTFEVHLHGVKFHRVYTGKDFLARFYYPEVTGEIWLEEVVQPDRPRTVALETV